MSTVGQLLKDLSDAKEHRRVKAMLKAARSRPHLMESQAINPRKSVMKTGHHVHAVNYSNAIALGDAIRKSIIKNEEYEAQQGQGMVHVKNGKPLTEHGAHLLGMPWPVNS